MGRGEAFDDLVLMVERYSAYKAMVQVKQGGVPPNSRSPTVSRKFGHCPPGGPVSAGAAGE